jgi:hypothetical protein
MKRAQWLIFLFAGTLGVGGGCGSTSGGSAAGAGGATATATSSSTGKGSGGGGGMALPCGGATCSPHGSCDAVNDRCQCDAGYDFDGTACVNVDECMLPKSACKPPATCKDTDGAFTCTCPAGYDDVNKDGSQCADVDECAAKTANCAMEATCTNLPGSFACTCPSGYADPQMNGTVCTEIDECAAKTANCDAAATCKNTTGSFTCTCPANYVDVNKNGTKCVAPAKSCKELLSLAPGLPSGLYVLDPDGNGAQPTFNARCDMVEAGGGWTLVLNSDTTFVRNSIGDSAANCFTASPCIALGYSKVPVTADVMLDVAGNAINGTNQEIRTIVTGVRATLIGKTMMTLMNTPKHYLLEKDDNSNLQNVFFTATDCGNQNRWFDYMGMLCGTSVITIFDDPNPAAPPANFGIGGTFAMDVDWQNQTGWPEKITFGSTAYFPPYFRIWVR